MMEILQNQIIPKFLYSIADSQKIKDWKTITSMIDSKTIDLGKISIYMTQYSHNRRLGSSETTLLLPLF